MSPTEGEHAFAVFAPAPDTSAGEVLLFGSSLKSEAEGNDIDIGVEGIKPSEFFKFYGELMFAISKPVDVVDLAEKNQFTQLILKDGVVIYG